MEIYISKNEHLGGILIRSDKVDNKELFFKFKTKIESLLGDRVLENELSYKGYHPFGQEPLHYNLGDTVRGSDTDISKIKELLSNIKGVDVND